MIGLINWELLQVLKFIDSNEDTNFIKIQKRFKVNPSTVNRWITYFLQENYINRKMCKYDKRVMLINITIKGSRIIKHLISL